MNKRLHVILACIVVVAFVWSGRGRAQEAPVAQPAPKPSPQAAQKPTPAPPGTQEPRPGSSPGTTYPNVRIEVTITDQVGGGPAIKKTMSLVANRSGSVRSGVNMPMTQTTYGAIGSGGVNTVPITSYNYRMMGLNLDARDLYLTPGGLIHVNLSLEYNPIDEAAEKSAPSTPLPASFSNFSESFTLELEPGKSLLVAQTSDPVPTRNRTLSVEVRATVVK